MEVTQIFVILAISAIELAGTQKNYGRYYTRQESVQSTVKNNEICQFSLGLVRKPRSDRLEGFERLISGYMNVFQTVGPVGGSIHVEKMTQNGWINDYQPFVLRRICDPPYNRLLEPFFDHFSGKMNKLECFLEKGNYTIKDWTMEDNIRLSAGDKFLFEKYRFTIALTIPGRKDPVCGFSVVIKVEDLDALEHALKSKRNNKRKSSNN